MLDDGHHCEFNNLVADMVDGAVQLCRPLLDTHDVESYVEYLLPGDRWLYMRPIAFLVAVNALRRFDYLQDAHWELGRNEEGRRRWVVGAKPTASA
jgi:hypothetical protein